MPLSAKVKQKLLRRVRMSEVLRTLFFYTTARKLQYRRKRWFILKQMLFRKSLMWLLAARTWLFLIYVIIICRIGRSIPIQYCPTYDKTYSIIPGQRMNCFHPRPVSRNLQQKYGVRNMCV